MKNVFFRRWKTIKKKVFFFQHIDPYKWSKLENGAHNLTKNVNLNFTLKKSK